MLHAKKILINDEKKKQKKNQPWLVINDQGFGLEVQRWVI